MTTQTAQLCDWCDRPAYRRIRYPDGWSDRACRAHLRWHWRVAREYGGKPEPI